MAVDTPQVQRKIAKWTLIVALLVGGIGYLFSFKDFTYGLFFGVVLCIVNFRVISWVLSIATSKASPDLARIISFVGYHVRFWLLVIILYFVIPVAHYTFTIGTFVGLFLPKVIMGVIVVLHTDDEWWSSEAESSGPTPEEVRKAKDEVDGLRFPGLDFDERFKKELGLNEDPKKDLKE